MVCMYEASTMYVCLSVCLSKFSQYELTQNQASQLDCTASIMQTITLPQHHMGLDLTTVHFQDTTVKQS